MIMKRIFALLILFATAPLSHAYVVSYIFEGTVTHFPDASLPIDQSNDLMIGFLSFDTEDFLTPPDGECHICQFSYSVTAGGQTWASQAVYGNTNPMGYLTSSNSLLTMQDDGPQSNSPLIPDLIYFRLNFKDALQQGVPPSADEFVSGSWNLTHFLSVYDPTINATMAGTIDKVTMRASVPEPSSLALASLGFAGLLLRRRFSK